MKVPVVERVEATIDRFCMFSQGDAVGIAVSGGRDSVVLLDVLSEIAARRNFRLSVLHVNHGLRPESQEEEEFVRREAEKRGLPFLAHRAVLGGGNLEEAARKARLRFFAAAKRDLQLDRIATGHTQSDQAETILFRLLRGSGVAGMRGIQPVTTEGLVRPLLEISRSDVDAWVAERKLSFREDSSNAETRFARNRIRHQLLPLLSEQWNPRIAETLARTAEIAAAEETFLTEAVEEIWTRRATIEPDGSVVMALEAPPVALALRRRLVRKAMEFVRGSLRQIDFDHVEAIIRMAESGDGHGRVVVPGVDVIRSFNWLRFSAPRNTADESRNWSFPLPIPSTLVAPGGTRIETGFEVLPCGYNEIGIGLRRDAAGSPLVLRNWRPGDTFQGVGRTGISKIKELFQEKRIPLWERRNWPVIVRQDEIIWAGEFGAAQGYGAGSAEPVFFVKLLRSGTSYRPLVNQNGDFRRH